MNRIVKEELDRLNITSKDSTTLPSSYWTKGKKENVQGTFFEPYTVGDHGISNLRTISRCAYGGIHPATLRAIAGKAWIINVCINHVIKKLKPYFQLLTDRKKRGFQILYKGEVVSKDIKGLTDTKIKEVQNFILKTGSLKDSDRDDLSKFCSKTIRDLLTLDQVATELQRNEAGNVIAFYAIDSATIERVIPDPDYPSLIKYLQIVDGTPSAAYTVKDLIFDYENPRTDIRHAFYGYSYVEQAVDLIVSVINSFMYNSGNFTENRLPKGLLLIDGDANTDTVEQMEDYIAEIMSGSPMNQWRVPILPAGKDGAGIKWQPLQGNSRDMEFSQWQDFLISGVVALFGCSMDELGLQSAKSQNMFERTGNAQMKESKSLILGDILTFFENYLNKIIEEAYPDFSLEFVGYEQTDLKAAADLDKTEVESYKTLNEKREEKGLERLDADWADIPLNPQCVQMYQASKANDMAGGDDTDGDDWEDDYGDDDNGDTDNSDDMDNESETPEEQPDNVVTKSLRV